MTLWHCDLTEYSQINQIWKIKRVSFSVLDCLFNLPSLLFQSFENLAVESGGCIPEKDDPPGESQ